MKVKQLGIDLAAIRKRILLFLESAFQFFRYLVEKLLLPALLALAGHYILLEYQNRNHERLHAERIRIEESRERLERARMLIGLLPKLSSQEAQERRASGIFVAEVLPEYTEAAVKIIGLLDDSDKGRQFTSAIRASGRSKDAARRLGEHLVNGREFESLTAYPSAYREYVEAWEAVAPEYAPDARAQELMSRARQEYSKGNMKNAAMLARQAAQAAYKALPEARNPR